MERDSNVIEGEVVDDLDIAEGYSPTQYGQGDLREALTSFLSNPNQRLTVANLSQALGLTPSQSKKLRSAIVAVGAGFGHNFLGDSIGEVPASVLGAIIGAWVAQRVLK